ncbi:MAG TPA: amidohydrolase family protein [Polyangiaceae bacterium]
MPAEFDVVVRQGLFFDGTGAPGAVRDVGIRDGRVAELSAGPLRAGPNTRVVEAAGAWVMPGFLDVHTHYDAEVLVAPGLGESVRHGVTTVFIGSCSLSTIYSDALDAADMFSRVEALPREHVLAALERSKNWSNPAEYVAALERLPLGPNVAAFIGHSDIRASVMGLGRATDPEVRPTPDELSAMERAVEEALDAGFVGLSTMTNPWDKLDGDRYRSRCLPSSYASLREFRRLGRILRRRGRVLQGIPNLNTKLDMFFFLGLSTGLGRQPLKVSLLAAADPKADRWVHRVFGPLAWLANGPGRGAFRWQHLPVKFEVYADGIDLVVFEEFGSGRAALHLRDEAERNTLMRDEAYRRWFRADFEKRFAPRVWHRDFHDAEIVACPDSSLVGKTVAAVAELRGTHPADTFLDLLVEHGKALRWRTTIANDRPEQLDELIQQAGVTIGFSDSGAHLRNMAFYNFGIHLLGRVQRAIEQGKPFLSVERAVYKLTRELAEFYELDAGRLHVGDRADLVVIDPKGLMADADHYAEAPMPEFGGLSRMVNRNDGAVLATLIGGEIVFRCGNFLDGYPAELGRGRFLRAGTTGDAQDGQRHEDRNPARPSTAGLARAAF